jgi:hypothetical protein
MTVQVLALDYFYPSIEQIFAVYLITFYHDETMIEIL